MTAREFIAAVKRDLAPHVAYGKYVLRHKWFVARAAFHIARLMPMPCGRIAWLWRMLVHDASKFRPSEWMPYAQSFYGESAESIATREVRGRMTAAQLGLAAQGYTDAALSTEIGTRAATIERERKAAFQRAWLLHQHRNPHHWQHHILHEDSGRTFILVPHAVYAYEMVADWLAAGPKALREHTMAEAVAETIVWYAKMHKAMLLRDVVRNTVENILAALAYEYGIAQHAAEVESLKHARASITIPGRVAPQS